LIEGVLTSSNNPLLSAIQGDLPQVRSEQEMIPLSTCKTLRRFRERALLQD
jgi:hypothetical protein